MKDHLEKIEESVIHQFGLNSFHLVAHSMGCLIALALAAKYSNSVKSITLVAPVSEDKRCYLWMNLLLFQNPISLSSYNPLLPENI